MTRHPRFAASLCIASILVAGSALADEGAPPGAGATAPPPKSTVTETPADIAAAPKDEATAALGPVERLPPSAYPAPRIRGIYGGSLWAIFHGLQWPYYPKTGIGVSGYAWIDTSYARFSSDDENTQGRKFLRQEGRALLRVTPTWSNGDYFIQGQAEIVANKDQSQDQSSSGSRIVDADDVWVRAGRWNKWDVQIGRFEGWEVYHLGMGLDVNTFERQGADVPSSNQHPPQYYGVTYMFPRESDGGQAAAHFYPTDYLRFELGTEIGANAAGQNILGARPIGILDFGWVKFKAGVEYVKTSNQTDGAVGNETKSRGGGAAIQFIINPYAEFGFNAARGLLDHNTNEGNPDETGSYTTTSFGGFANFRLVENLLLGGGADYTEQLDLHYDQVRGDFGRFKHTQAFIAVQYVFAKQLFVKFVGGFAEFKIPPAAGDQTLTSHTNQMVSGRLRVMYLF